MDAIILAGGFGSRLRPLTYHIPKPLIPIADMPIIEHIVSGLYRYVDRIVLATSYRTEDFVDFSKTVLKKYGKKIYIAHEPEPLGTGGGIKNAYAYTNKGDVVVVNGDIISSLSFDSIIEHHNSTDADATIALWQVDDSRSYGAVKLNDDDMVLEFKEKPEEGNKYSTHINAGVYILGPKLMDLIDIGHGAVSLEHEIFPKALVKGLKISGYKFDGYWFDSGTPQRILEAHATILKERFNGKGVVEDISKGIIEPPVYIETDIDREDTRIGPYVSIYSGVKIGHNVSIKNSIILNNAVIEDDTVIENTIVGFNAILKKGIRIVNKGIYY